MSAKRLQAGVSAIELMIVVAIAGILAAIAVPSFSDLINNTRLNSTMTQLTSDLNRARVEAIKRNMRVLVCVRNNAGTDCGTGTNWQNGWLVCYDNSPQDGSCDASTTTTPNPIVVHQALNANLALAGPASIYFSPNGTQGAGGAVTLTLSGNWTGAVNNVATIAATGNISKTP